MSERPSRDWRPTPEQYAADLRLIAEFDRLMAVVKPEPTLSDVLVEEDETVPQVAAAIDIHESVLGALLVGRARGPFSGRFATALARHWHRRKAAVIEAIAATLAQPASAHASADGEHAMARQTFAELVAASAMSDERKEYWLGDD